MKKLTKILALSLALCMVLALCACGGAKKEEAPAEGASKGKLTMATNVDFPPYEYYDDETGEATGIDVELVKMACEKIGYEVEVVDMDFGSVVSGVATGKYDIGAGAITITEERKQSVNFTDSYATGIQAVIVTEDSAIASVDDLYADDVVIGVQQDTTGDIYCTDDFGEDHVARFNKGADAVQALLTGKCQAVVIDNSPAKTFVEQNAGLKILPTVYAEEEYGFEIAKDNAELYDAVNGALKELIADGTVQAIIDKYISAD